MIWNRLCVSCQNRFYEIVKGRNAKGTAPRKLHLEPRRLGVVLDPGGASERYVELAEPATIDAAEIALASLRVAGVPLAFCRPRGGLPAITVAELARMFATKPKRVRGDDLLARDIVRNAKRRRRPAAKPERRGVVAELARRYGAE